MTQWSLVVSFSAAAEDSSAALQVYEQGKALYDQKNYGAALEKFEEGLERLCRLRRLDDGRYAYLPPSPPTRLSLSLRERGARRDGR